MAIPKWSTASGTIATIEEAVDYTTSLVATDTDGDTLTYSKIAGTLPNGLYLSTAGVISGRPLEVGKRTENEFVVRVTDGTYKVDRTFKLIVEGSDAPIWTTSAGTLGTYTDGDYLYYQLQASDNDTDIKFYKVVGGALPPNVTLDTQTGLLSGVIQPANIADFDSSQIGFDNGEFDTDDFDLFIISGSIDKYYEFTVRVSDGISYSDRTFNVFVQGLNSLVTTSDMDTITADTTSVSSDEGDVRALYFVQNAGRLATVRHQNYYVIHVDVEDPGDSLNYIGDTTVSYEISSGSLPPGLAISSTSGEIYGDIPYIQSSETTYTFTVKATKSSSFYPDSSYFREFNILVQGEAYNAIEWTRTKEMVL